MIHFRCAGCAGWVGAGDGAAGTGVTCRRCGQVNICPVSAGADAAVAPRIATSTPQRRVSAVLTWLLMTVLMGGAVMLAAWALWFGAESRAGVNASAPSLVSPVDARQQEILRENAGRPGDPELVNAYQAINARHFVGALPAMAVRWEPALADVGALAAQAFTLEGMFGNVGKELIILLNPSVKGNRRALDRALCHEMVHAYLFAQGDRTTSHGPAFKAVLQRLSRESAFEGIAASDVEQANLRAWIDEESARIDFERRAMDAIGREITRDRDELDRDLAAINARTAAANAEGRGGPDATEINEIETRRARFNERVVAVNARLERDRADLAHFNREVARYNLMIAYPDGLDEQSLVSPKASAAGGGG